MISEIKKYQSKAITVSEYILILNEGLKNFKASIVGEISSVTIAASGHAYFSLKDKTDNSVIYCIMWRSGYELCGVKIEEGLEIIASGVPNIYAPKGDLRFIASTIELSGEGSLKKAYEELRKKLANEGLFDPERKRELPTFPQAIGIITSREGAVMADFISNVGKHGFDLKLIHSAVEGQQALPELIRAIKQFKKEDLDVLVIIRGGGSLESLQAFNNEALVRELVSFPAPIIAGIGHHKDVSLVSMAADHAVSTPTAAANLLNQIWEEHKIQLLRYEQNVLNSYARALTNWSVNVSQLAETIIDSLKGVVSHWDNRLKLFERTVTSNDPRRQFKIGFSIAKFNGKILKTINQISAGSEIDTQISDGIVKSKVESVKNYEKDR